MLAPAAIAATLGLGQFPVKMAAPICLNRNGNAITLSPALYEQLIQQCTGEPSDPAVTAAALRAVIRTRREQGLAELIFGTVYPFSMHSILLHRWFGLGRDRLAGGFAAHRAAAPVHGHRNPDRAHRRLLRRRPMERPGRSIAAAASSCMPGSTSWPTLRRRVLVWRAAEIEARAEQVAALNRAIIKASHWCADPANWAILASDLSRPGILGAPAKVIEEVLSGRIPIGAHSFQQTAKSFMRLDPAILRPRKDDAVFIYQCMHEAKLVEATPGRAVTGTIDLPGRYLRSGVRQARRQPRLDLRHQAGDGVPARARYLRRRRSTQRCPRGFLGLE